MNIKRTRKHATRRYEVRGTATLEDLAAIARQQPPSVKRLVFAGTSCWIRSGIVSSARRIDDESNLYEIEDETVSSFASCLPGVQGPASVIRFAGTVSHHNMTKKIRCAWPVRTGSSEKIPLAAFCGETPLRVGERYYVEELPIVTGDFGDGAPGLSRTFTGIAFFRESERA